MKTWRTLSLFFVIAIMLNACTPSDVKVNLSRVDSLENQVSKLAFDMEQINPDFYKNALIENERKAKYIQDNFKDTLTKDEAFLFGDYGRVRKNLNRYLEAYSKQNEQIKTAQNQLVTLKKDVKNQLILQDEFNMYFQSEAQAIQAMQETVSNLGAWGNSTQRYYTRLDSAVNVFIQQKLDTAFAQ